MDTVSSSGRVYPARIFRREVRAYAARVIAGEAFGEVEHPTPTSPHFRDVNLCNVSHRVLDLWWKGNELHGVVQVLPSAAGKAIWRLCAHGEAVSFASRGWATLVPDQDGTGVVTVAPDLQLIAFDAVRVGSLSSPFRPVSGTWVNLKAAELLQARKTYWKAQREVAPQWPYGHGCPSQQVVAAADRSSPAAVRRSWAAASPALELMSHMPEFRQRARALFQLAASGQRLLDAAVVQVIVTKTAAVDAAQLLGGHLVGFHTSESGEEADPPQDEDRHQPALVKYPVPPPGAAWQPQHMRGAPTPVLWVALQMLLLACCDTNAHVALTAGADDGVSDTSSDATSSIGDVNDFYELEAFELDGPPLHVPE